MGGAKLEAHVDPDLWLPFWVVSMAVKQKELVKTKNGEWREAELIKLKEKGGGRAERHGWALELSCFCPS